ncbi:hypothetical protein EVAR_102993_1 [Eumeta japonica]|uniref:Uncharacterized protein n=1 Tax=Eumeta variegata TaxID=151549 RepID=A0A4C1UQC8_EUMVA|nr:hypothetical protein EVAR_102993_1 [Eumeta japonica]
MRLCCNILKTFSGFGASFRPNTELNPDRNYATVYCRLGSFFHSHIKPASPRLRTAIKVTSNLYLSSLTASFRSVSRGEISSAALVTAARGCSLERLGNGLYFSSLLILSGTHCRRDISTFLFTIELLGERNGKV